MMGDNSKKALDSRYFGAIKKGKIIGKIYKIVEPKERFGPLE